MNRHCHRGYLWAALALGSALGIVIVVLFAYGGATADPVLILPATTLLGLLVWTQLWGLGSSQAVPWYRRQRFQPRVEPSPQTRLVLSAIDAAARDRGTGCIDVAQHLAAGVASRLIAHYDADPADPLATAQSVLSPELFNFLDAALRGERIRLSRRSLDTYIKEVESL